MSEDSHVGNQIRGYKATLSNPHTSEDAKAHAKAMIEELSGGEEAPSGGKGHEEHESKTKSHGHATSEKKSGMTSSKGGIPPEETDDFTFGRPDVTPVTIEAKVAE